MVQIDTIAVAVDINHFTVEAQVNAQLLGGKGEFLQWLFQAAQKGNVGAIVVLSIGILAVAYTLWENVVVHLIPTPRTPNWTRWRWLGIVSVSCLPFACIAFWLFIRDTKWPSSSCPLLLQLYLRGQPRNVVTRS